MNNEFGFSYFMKAICDSKLKCSERQRICLVKLVLTGRRLHKKHQVQLTILLKVVAFMCKYVKTTHLIFVMDPTRSNARDASHCE